MVAVGMLALLVASLVLTYSVVSRYFFKASTDWQDEIAVFCSSARPSCAARTCSRMRGHVGIEAIAAILPRARRTACAVIVVDIAALAFCAFFAWKSWTLLHEAWVDKQTTSSSWAPPLWIPYGADGGRHDAARRSSSLAAA